MTGNIRPRPVRIADYDPEWPARFSREAARIRSALGPRVLQIEHTGSTSVPGLAAKPVIDIVLAVADSAVEDDYAPALTSAGYELCIREPGWFEHRMFQVAATSDINLHVFSAACPEIARMVAFRDWLRIHADDRALYAATKRAVAQHAWNSVQDYADAKTAVIKEISARASVPRS